MKTMFKNSFQVKRTKNRNQQFCLSKAVEVQTCEVFKTSQVFQGCICLFDALNLNSFLRPLGLILVFFILLNKVEAKGVVDIIVEHDPSVPKSQKEAMLILPGLEDSPKGREHLKERFGQRAYDLYIPDFHDRKSFDGTVENLKEFYAEQALDQYHKVHVFSYILGSWALNTFINETGSHNIASIVYDRSPLQERAPWYVRDHLRLPGRMAKGKIVLDLGETPYPVIEAGNIRIGILVESYATWFVKLFPKGIMSYGPITWDNLDFQQQARDQMYIPLNHDQMYTMLEGLDEEVIGFFRNGKFSAEARRVPFAWDPFEGPPEGN